jgi:hypothetical protein
MTKQEQNQLSGVNIPDRTAIAKVLAVTNTGKLLNDLPVLSIYLEVQDPEVVPFNVNVKRAVNRLLIPRVGDLCRICYPPGYPEELLIQELL